MPKRKSDRSTDGECSGSQRKYAEDEDMEMEESVEQVERTEVGTLERIILKNFMCHENLDIAFGPNINFIVGSSGSGKSSVLTGLVVGLGGLASVTNRGSEVRSFVKIGKHSGEVEIHLRNSGPNAYNHDVYGDKVKIHTKIFANGGTQYTIKSDKGRVVSDKLEELKRIKDFFNIQVENPVAVLNQEMSRNLMQTMNPTDKYRFFLKATQLEQMKEQYDAASAPIKEKTLCSILEYEKILPVLSDKVRHWEEKLKNLDTISELNKKVKLLKHEMAWALVAEKQKEKDVQSYSQQILELEERQVQCVRELKDVQDRCKAAEKEFQEIEAQAKARANSDDPLRDELNSAQLAVDEAQQHKKHYQDQLKEQESTIAKLKKHVLALEKEVEEDRVKAVQICAEPVLTTRTPSDIGRELNQINMRIKQERETLGDSAVIIRCYDESCTRYLEVKRELMRSKKFNESLGKVLDRANKSYEEIKRNIAMRIKVSFLVMLSSQLYSGHMTFNHKSQFLEMGVAPNKDSEVNNDLESLSGWEQSFSTVCFILSLWEAMESPFRCLDEFDVLMDLVNGRVSMDMMMQMTRTMTNKQIIFLTQQNMSELSMSMAWRPKIFLMPSPDRGNEEGQTSQDKKKANVK